MNHCRHSIVGEKHLLKGRYWVATHVAAVMRRLRKYAIFKAPNTPFLAIFGILRSVKECLGRQIGTDALSESLDFFESRAQYARAKYHDLAVFHAEPTRR